MVIAALREQAGWNRDWPAGRPLRGGDLGAGAEGQGNGPVSLGGGVAHREEQEPRREGLSTR